MRLTAWTWMIFGAIMAAVAGYIYLFVPKNGQPNNAMALFFFIGIVFIVVGLVKLLFKRVDDKVIFDSVEKSIQDKSEKIIQIPEVERRPNRIDETINSMAVSQQHGHREAQTVQKVPPQRPHHTNSYYQLHQYKGPANAPTAGTHAQHPVSQHNQHPQHSQTSPASPHVTNVSDHGLRCRKCGNVNSGHANYCHGCGNRLK